MSVDLRFEVLGPVRVLRGDQEVRVTGRRQRLLLALLLADAPRVVPTARLVDALWNGDSEPQDPINTLHQYVAHLRRALDGGLTGSGDSAVETSPPGYRMVPSVGGLDTMDLASITVRLNELHQQGDFSAAGEVASRALELWRGTPFAEFADHPFLIPFVDALAERRLVVLERLVSSLAALGNHPRVVEVLSAEPMWADRPSLASAHVAALAFTDRQADALAAAEQHRRTLAERGLEPTVAFRRLADDVAVRGRPRLDHTHLAIVRSATAENLRTLLSHLPASRESERGTEDRFDLELAAVDAANDPEVSVDPDFWLHTLQLRQPGVLELLGATDLTTPREVEVVLRLVVAYARFWDWTGDHHRLRHELDRAVKACLLVGVEADRSIAEAAGWLAYSHGDDPTRSAQYLELAHERTKDDPLGAGRALAVESVILRRHAPTAALDRGANAVRLLSHHGTADEAAYAHLVSALAAIDADLSRAAEWHAGEADGLYRQIGDPRGLAWVDVVQSRLEGEQPSFAPRFSAEHAEHTTNTMLREDSDPR